MHTRQIAQAKAKGSDTSDLESSLTEEQTKLTKNISTDKSNAGKASQGVTGSSSSSSSSASSSSSSSTASDASSTSAANASSTSAAAAASSTARAADAAVSAQSDVVTQTAANFKELEYVFVL